MRGLLVTGFEAFGGADHNPSGAAVARMAEDPAWSHVAFAVLPVNWSGAPAMLRARATAVEAGAVLMFGLAAGATGLRVERQAYNLAGDGLTDDAAVRGNGQELVPGGAAVITTGVDAEALCAVLTAEGIPVTVSDDPGRYLCNAVYHSALVGGEAYARRTLFVHVPATRRLGGPWEEAMVSGWIETAVAAYVRLTGAGTGT